MARKPLLPIALPTWVDCEALSTADRKWSSEVIGAKKVNGEGLSMPYIATISLETGAGLSVPCC